MDGTTSTWSTPREMVQIILAPRHINRTVFIALMVGTVFFAMNQLGIIVEGRATTAVWIKVALTYVTPLRVSNFGLLSAMRRPHLSSPGHRRGDEMEIKMTTNPSTS